MQKSSKPTQPILNDRPVPVRRRGVIALLFLLLLLGGVALLRQPANTEPVAAAESVIESVVQPPVAACAPPVSRFVLPAHHADTTLEISSSTRLFVPELAFVDSSGAPVEEPVEIAFQEIMNPVETFLSGIPMALDSERVLKSAGMVNIQGRLASGQNVQIDPQRALELEFESLDADTAYTAWALDTVSGEWIEIDAATEVVVSDAEERLAVLEEAIPAPPVIIGNNAFTIGDETGYFPELAEYEFVHFQPVDGKQCGFTCTHIDVTPRANGIYDVHFIGHEYGYKAIAREEVCSCYLAFEEGEQYSEALQTYQRKNRKLLNERDRERKRIQREWERYLRAVGRQQMLAEGNKAEWRQRSAEKRVSRTLAVLQFGILNIDKPTVIDAPVNLMATFVDSTGTELALQNLQVVDLTSQILYPCRDNRVQLHPTQRQVLLGTTPTGDLAYVRAYELSGLSRSLERYTFPVQVARLDDLSPQAVLDLLIPADGQVSI